MNPYYYGFFQDLENDVIEHWDKKGVSVWKSFISSETQYYIDQIVEYEMEGWAKTVLSNPDFCLVELGFNPGDYASYIAMKGQQ